MKICLILPNVFPIPATKDGAVETLVEDIINVNEKNKQLDITCISVYEEKAYELSKGYKHTNFHYINNEENENKPRDLFFKGFDQSFKDYMDSIYKFIKDKQFDTIIFEGGDWIGYRYLIEKLNNEICVLHIHGTCRCTKPEDGQIYDDYLSISEYVKDKFAETGYVPKNKIFTVYNGIDLSKFQKEVSDKEKEELRKKYNINKNDVVLMFCGRTVKEKGIKELLLACKKIKENENIKLLIIGNSNFGNEVITDYDKELLEISKDMQGIVTHTGFIHNNELYKIHSIADIAVVPSIYEEGFGLVLVEAMASGLPIISTKMGGIPEIVDSNCGVLVENDEKLVENLSKKILYLVQNSELRKQMGAKGKEDCQKYSKEKFYENFVQTLEKIKQLEMNKKK